MKVYIEIEPEILKEVEVVSLVDHDKQVRKEVCERLDKIIEKYLCKKGRYRESLDISSIIKQVMKENLDQIQGDRQ
jgi:hypothetical protein